MNVWFTPRARKRAQVVSAGWRSNRLDAPLIFEEELERALAGLQPSSLARRPVYETIRGQPIRRVLLPKSEQHLYLSVVAGEDTVIVHAIWGARRGRGPSL